MSVSLSDFKRDKDFLICVDSDGCAVDTMDIKHKKCFGPCMVREWGLERWEGPILKRWNEINLYSMTRGINRFKGLAAALGEIDREYQHIEGVGELEEWTRSAPELSNPALERVIEKGGGEIFKKALSWSQAVNACIAALPWEVKRAFPGVREAFEGVRGFADIVIVSSANRDAVEEEWDRFGLLPLVDMVLCQDAGSKAHCIAALREKGYPQDHILMVGDAPGDMKAAETNGVWFYPIMVRREEESWREFPNAAQLLRAGLYADYGRTKREEFLANLTGGETRRGI